MLHTAASAAAAASPSSLSGALTQKIREFLLHERWSQRELATRLGVTQGAVSYLLAEKRRASVLDFYERLARVFGQPLSVLIADLEHRVNLDDKDRTITEGAAHGTSARAVFVAATSHATREDSVVLHAVLQALIDARIDAAHARIDARVAAALAQHPVPKPPRARKRRRTPAKKRADDRTAAGRVLHPRPGVDEALPVGRDSPGRGLRRTG